MLGGLSHRSEHYLGRKTLLLYCTRPAPALAKFPVTRLKRNFHVPDDKAVINAEDALYCIRAGMSNEALMEKFQLSKKGLESLFRKLVAAGKIDETELDARRHSLRMQSWVYSMGYHFLHKEMEETRSEDAAVPPEAPSSWQRNKHYFFGLIGVIVGGALVLVGMFVVDLWNAAKTTSEPGPLAPLIAAVDRDIAEADQLIKILRAIARNPTGEEYTRALTTASDYQGCLSNCSKSFRGSSESDKLLLINCKKACMAMYSERVKEIRERYHGDAGLE